MENKVKGVDFYFGSFGRLLPLLTACIIIIWAACSQSNVNGYVVAFFAAVIVGAVFAIQLIKGKKNGGAPAQKQDAAEAA